MKLFNKRRISVVLMTSIILLHGVSPLLAIATTVESSTVESSTVEPTTNSNSVETPEPVTEEIPVAEDQVTEPEQIDVESDYDENELSSEYQETSAQPVVKLTKKNLTGEVTVEGEILSGNEQQETRRTETHLTKLVLQCSESDDSWEDVHTFEIADDAAAIQVENYAFDFSKSLDEVKAGNYRLIAEYDIQEYEESNLKRVNHHKGMFVVGKVEEKTVSEASSDTINSSAPSAKESNEVLFRGSLYGSNGLSRSNPDLDRFYEGVDGNNFVNINNISKHQATVQAKGRPPEGISSFKGDIYIVCSTDQNYVKNTLLPSSFDSHGIFESGWNRIVTSGGKVLKATNKDMGVNFIRDVEGTLEGLSPSTNYHVWMFRKTEADPLLGTPERYTKHCPPGTSFPTGDANFYIPYKFRTDDPIPLKIDPPRFDQSSATKNSIVMLGQRYYGDIWGTSGTGRVNVSDNITIDYNKVTNLGHDTVLGTTGNNTRYRNATINGLSAGTRYLGQVVLKDYIGTEKSTPWSESQVFYTVNDPEPPSLIDATKTSPAKLTIRGNYGATSGVNGAHPQSDLDVDVRIKHDGSAIDPGWNWELELPATLEGEMNNKVDRYPNWAKPNVQFRITGLLNNNPYWVAYRVRNPSGKWSAFKSSKFQTKALPISRISAPKILYYGNDATKVELQPGNYEGGWAQKAWVDIYEVKANGTITQFRSPEDIPHSQNNQQNYAPSPNKYNITGLTPGSKYRIYIRMRDNNGDEKTSDEYLEFVTRNNVERPEIVNKERPPSATFKATYTALPGLTDAHPRDGLDDIEIQISNESSPNWNSISKLTTGGSGIRLETAPTFNRNTNPPSVNFKIVGLGYNTNYKVRYRIRNKSRDYGQWSDYSAVTDFTTLANPISYVSQPNIKYNDDHAADKVILEEGTYTGGWIRENSAWAELYNLGNDEQNWGSWSERIPLPYSNNPQNYANGDYEITNLDPGSKYGIQIHLMDNTNNDDGTQHGPNKFSLPRIFYTLNEVDPISNISYTTPTTNTNAQASMHGVYKVSNNAERQAHPKISGVSDGYDGHKGVDIQIKSAQDPNYSSWKSLKSTATSDSPAIVSDLNINTLDKRVEFTLSNLRANTTYQVKYRVKNNSNQWSAYSTANTINTQPRISGLYLSNVNVPDFDFGSLQARSYTVEKGLSTSGNIDDFSMLVENINVSSKWELTAKLTQLETGDGSNLSIAGAQIRMSKTLEKTVDDVNWTTVTNGFNGLGTNTVTLAANGSSQSLFEATTISSGQGTFRNRINSNSVKLIIPGNAAQNGRIYKGKVRWSMGVLP